MKELQKLKGLELPDDLLEAVSGGRSPEEEADEEAARAVEAAKQRLICGWPELDDDTKRELFAVPMYAEFLTSLGLTLD